MTVAHVSLLPLSAIQAERFAVIASAESSKLLDMEKIYLTNPIFELGDKFTIGDDPTIYRVDRKDKVGDITAFSIVTESLPPSTSH